MVERRPYKASVHGFDSLIGYRVVIQVAEEAVCEAVTDGFESRTTLEAVNLPGYPSGQKERSVKPLLRLRWFESSTRHVNTITETQLPPLIIDRSPELRRSKHIPGVANHQTQVDLPAGETCTQGDGTSCVIAEMLKTLLPGCEPHIESENPYVITSAGNLLYVNLDEVLVDAIGRFDRGDLNAFDGINVTVTWD